MSVSISLLKDKSVKSHGGFLRCLLQNPKSLNVAENNRSAFTPHGFFSSLLAPRTTQTIHSASSIQSNHFSRHTYGCLARSLAEQINTPAHARTGAQRCRSVAVAVAFKWVQTCEVPKWSGKGRYDKKTAALEKLMTDKAGFRFRCHSFESTNVPLQRLSFYLFVFNTS